MLKKIAIIITAAALLTGGFFLGRLTDKKEDRLQTAKEDVHTSDVASLPDATDTPSSPTDTPAVTCTDDPISENDSIIIGEDGKVRIVRGGNKVYFDVTNTPVPTEKTPAATRKPENTPTVAMTDTPSPEPTATIPATATPAPTDTPEPTKAPATKAPDPTEAPKATDTPSPTDPLAVHVHEWKDLYGELETPGHWEIISQGSTEYVTESYLVCDGCGKSEKKFAHQAEFYKHCEDEGSTYSVKTEIVDVVKTEPEKKWVEGKVEEVLIGYRCPGCGEIQILDKYKDIVVDLGGYAK